MSIGALDTDSSALAARLELQHRLSQFDLNSWIFSHLSIDPGQKWLDLGCGRGEQSLPIAQRAGPDGRVTSVDLSEESLAEVRQQAETLGLGDRIETVHASLDTFEERIVKGDYDGAVGSYSLYYAADSETLFAKIARLLAETGQLFFCGPAFDNNLELRRLVASAKGEDSSLRPTRPSQFMEELAPAACRRHFANVQVFTFENPVVFEAEKDLIAYWRSHNLFDPAADERFREFAAGHFAAGRPFTNTKRGIGILATHPVEGATGATQR